MHEPGVGYLGGVDVPAFLADDENALASAAPTVRVGVVRRPTLSFGVGHRPDPAVQARAAERGWGLAGRRSGGTSLYHAPGDLVWSIVLPRRDARVGRDYAHAYVRLGAGLVDWLAGLGVTSAWELASDAFPPYCLLNGLGRTLRVSGRAVAGAAQHATRSGMLHHGGVSVSLDETALTAVFDLPDDVLAADLAGLRTFGVSETSERLARGLTAALERFVAAPATR